MESHEDEAFNEIERRAKQRMEAVRAAMLRVEEDDDIQDYKRPWVGLTDEEIEQMGLSNYIKVVRETETKLKEKNT
jgi:hypothetical protein